MKKSSTSSSISRGAARGKSPLGRPAPVQIKRILVPTDFSAHARDALDHARSLAGKFDARLTLLHVFEPINLAYESISAQMIDCAQRAEDDARELLADLYAELKDAPGPAVHAVFVTGRPEEKIVGMAKKLKQDLIVISTHGHTGLKHLFLGSVAERVLRLATCPVLVLRMAD
jgi:nucleotide-binding universal stress UspA family protein